MENQFNAGRVAYSMPTIHHKNEVGLSLIALGLVLAPIFIIQLSSLLHWSLSFLWLIAVLSPIAGLIVGVVSLRRGKNRIGIAGMIIAIIAITTPLAVGAFVIIFFIGAMTGVISLM